MNEKISIIIPCYNVEKYIVRCLKSVEEQTFGIENLEIILVNDASTDNTISYLRAFEDRYIESVLLIDFKVNRGLSAARNAGLRMATGEYVFFLDSDDAIEKTTIQKLYEKAIEYKGDAVHCGYRQIYSEEQAFSSRGGDDWLKDLSDVNNKKWYIVHMPKLTVWGTLWNRNFLTENNLWMNEELRMSEDVFFTGISMFLIKNCYYINEQLYFYYVNYDSLSRHTEYSTEKNRGVIEACRQLISELKSRSLLDEAMTKYYKDEFGWYIIGPSYFYTMNNIYKEIDFFKRFVTDVCPDIKENRYLQVLDDIHAEWMRHFK